MLTRGELDGLTVVCAVTVLVHILASAYAAWVQDRDTRALRSEVRSELDELRAWCWAAARKLGWDDEEDDGPGEEDDPPDDAPDPTPPAGQLDDTAVSHPADTWARQQALLARYAHIGQHRT